MNSEAFEFSGESEWREESEGYSAEVFSEEELQELAAELLSVTNEAELDQFLGGLLKKAASAIGSAVKSPIAQQVGSMLKGVAKKHLPQAGAALGGLAGGALGTAAGAIPFVGPAIAPFASTLGSRAGSSLGQAAGGWLAGKLEMESMSQEEAEFEVAKQFVRVAGEAVKNASAAPTGAPPAAVARGAVTAALQKVAPAVLDSPHGAANSGRWIRRGRTIVLLGV
jgi:hypothetical protein